VNRRLFLGLVGAAGVGLAAGAEASAAAAGGTKDDGDRCYARSQTGSCQLHWSVETDERIVALTFDDGPNPRYTPAILELLAHHGARATFFAIGANLERHLGLAREVTAQGHEVANHTYAHERIEQLDFREVREEVARGAGAIESATGRTSRWLRPPRGMVTGAVVAAAAAEGHDVAMWSVSRGSSTADDDDAGVCTALLADLQPGAIVLLHDGVGATDDGRPQLLRRRDAELRALGPFLEQASAAGYRFVTLGELVDRRPADADSLLV
jgi:peptidoglycan/xylan/chitin deacetylase (PgdA/CDA1 family)